MPERATAPLTVDWPAPTSMSDPSEPTPHRVDKPGGAACLPSRAAPPGVAPMDAAANAASAQQQVFGTPVPGPRLRASVPAGVGTVYYGTVNYNYNYYGSAILDMEEMISQQTVVSSKRKLEMEEITTKILLLRRLGKDDEAAELVAQLMVM